MEVIITPSMPSICNTAADILRISDLLCELKEDGIINKDMTSGEFIAICLQRGINEYRKDLRVFDC